MKILFLDFDGVICTEESYSKARKKYGVTHTGFPPSFTLINPELVARVQEICDATQAKIVISSTWRYLHEWDEVTGFLTNHNLRAEVIGKTPDDSNLPAKKKLSQFLAIGMARADEIAAWLEQNPDVSINDIVILDDDVGSFDPDEHSILRQRVVGTEFSDIPPDIKAGLQPEHVQKAIRLLNG